MRTFEEAADSVTCRIAGPDDVEEEVFCSYLIACDGGRSSVRGRLGIELSGRPDLSKFVSIYFRAPEFTRAHDFGHANIFFPLHRDHRGFLLNWDGGITFTYHVILEDDQSWEDVDPTAAIHGVLGRPTPVEILSIQPWTAHALVADRYRQGRVFLAGDAVHLFSPTGGFGMNTGVSDVIDLAWKIEACLDGWAGPRLLDSYEAERRPIGFRNTLEAADCFDRLYAVMREGDVIDEESAEGEATRERLRKMILEQEKLIVSSGTLLGYRYENSDIIVPDGTEEPPDDARQYVPVARPGHRAPHMWLADDTSILDHFAKGFTLLVLGADDDSLAPEIENFSDAAHRIGLPLTVVTIPAPAAAALYGAKLALIRPDLMVAWRGMGSPIDAPRILDTVRGS